MWQGGADPGQLKDVGFRLTKLWKFGTLSNYLLRDSYKICKVYTRHEAT